MFRCARAGRLHPHCVFTHVDRPVAPSRQPARERLPRFPRRAASGGIRRGDSRGPREPDGAGHRQLDLPASAAGGDLPRACGRRPAAGAAAGRTRAPRRRGGRARRRRGHQRAVADRRRRRRPVAQHEPDPRNRRRAALGARAGGRRQGSAQCGAEAARTVFRAGAVDVEPRDRRRDDQYRRERAGQLHVRQDARSRARTRFRADGRRAAAQRCARRRRAGAPLRAAGPHRQGLSHRAPHQRRPGRADRREASEAQPLPDRLRPRAPARTRRPLQPEQRAVRRGGFARLRRRGAAQRVADPEVFGAGQRALCGLHGCVA
ncbi:hypothetical protein BSE24067_00437 [Burkholderia seminalis]|nr:hypothetical protein BSE24067_00437 [Burkholderia seminalis]